MASFDRSIPPGGEGKIALRLNTEGYDGDVRKKAYVYSNDLSKRVQTISIKVRVKTPITISPRSLFFKGKIGQTLKRAIQISAKEEKPLRLIPDQFNLEKIMSFELKEIEAGKEFQLVFNVNPTRSGFFRGELKLKTNYPEKPLLTIPIRGTVRTEPPAAKPMQNR